MMVDEANNRYLISFFDGQFARLADTDTLFEGHTPLGEGPSLGITSYGFSGTRFRSRPSPAPDDTAPLS